MENRNQKLRIEVLLPSLLLAVLFTSIFALKSSRESGLIYASQNKDTDANKPAADANKPTKPEQKAPKGKAQKPSRPRHTHPAFSQRIEERKKMVSAHIEGFSIYDPNVLASLRTVPRHGFVRHPDEGTWARNRRRAYRNHPLPIGMGQTISQPYIVAYMTEALKLRPKHKVLEVGTGSGYQAAVCAEIAAEVYTIEIIEELAESAKQRLKKLGYANVFAKAADGYFGWEEKGPFDTIIVTCAAGLVPPPLIEQLKPGGRMI